MNNLSKTVKMIKMISKQCKLSNLNSWERLHLKWRAVVNPITKKMLILKNMMKQIKKWKKLFKTKMKILTIHKMKKIINKWQKMINKKRKPCELQ
jgi:hypothetical protein